MAIKLLQNQIQTIANAPKSVVPMLMEQFHILYDQTYYSASSKLYEGITNNNLIFSDNLVVGNLFLFNNNNNNNNIISMRKFSSNKIGN